MRQSCWAACAACICPSVESVTAYCSADLQAEQNVPLAGHPCCGHKEAAQESVAEGKQLLKASCSRGQTLVEGKERVKGKQQLRADCSRGETQSRANSSQGQTVVKGKQQLRANSRPPLVVSSRCVLLCCVDHLPLEDRM